MIQTRVGAEVGYFFFFFFFFSLSSPAVYYVCLLQVSVYSFSADGTVADTHTHYKIPWNQVRQTIRTPYQSPPFLGGAATIVGCKFWPPHRFKAERALGLVGFVLRRWWASFGGVTFPLASVLGEEKVPAQASAFVSWFYVWCAHALIVRTRFLPFTGPPACSLRSSVSFGFLLFLRRLPKTHYNYR